MTAAVLHQGVHNSQPDRLWPVVQGADSMAAYLAPLCSVPRACPRSSIAVVVDCGSVGSPGLGSDCCSDLSAIEAA